MHSLFIHLLVSIWVVFCFLAVVNKAVVNVGVQIPLQDTDFNPVPEVMVMWEIYF